MSNVERNPKAEDRTGQGRAAAVSVSLLLSYRNEYFLQYGYGPDGAIVSYYFNEDSIVFPELELVGGQLAALESPLRNQPILHTGARLPHRPHPATDRRITG